MHSPDPASKSITCPLFGYTRCSAPRRRLTKGPTHRLDEAGKSTYTCYNAPDGTLFVRVRKRTFDHPFKRRWITAWFRCLPRTLKVVKGEDE